MKKQISPVVMLAVIALFVAVIGFFGYRAITPQVDDPRAPSAETMKARMMGGGGGPQGSAARPGGPPSYGGSSGYRNGPPQGYGNR